MFGEGWGGCFVILGGYCGGFRWGFRRRRVLVIFREGGFVILLVLNEIVGSGVVLFFLF